MDARAWFNVRMVVVGAMLLVLYTPLVAVAFWAGAPLYATLAAIVGGLALQYWLGKRRALKSVNAERIDASTPIGEKLHEQTEELAKRLDVPEPTLWVCSSGSPNAFAVGRKGAGHVILDISLLKLLDGHEIDAVIAHELSHLRSRDVIAMEIGEGAAAIMFYCFTLIEGAIRGGDTSRGYTSVDSVAGSVAHTLVMFLVFAISRQREYIADADAKWALGGNGEPLARGLQKIETIHARGQSVDPPEAVEALAISGHWSIPILGSTHPPMDNRIAKLRQD